MESFSGTIKDLSPLGMGVVDHPEGRVFFVAGTWPGDQGVFEIESREKKYGFARLIELQTPSPDREPNPCVHFGFQKGQCGNCAWLGIKYDKQLEQKQKTVEYLLKRNLPIEGEFLASHVVKPIWPSEKVFSYRNRAQLKTDGDKIGYVSPNTKVLAPIVDCLVLTDKNRKTLAELQSQLPKSQWKPRRPYLWSQMEIDEEVTAANFVLNQKIPFRQANSEQNERMKSWLGEKLAPLEQKQTVLELFCGAGNFTEIISDAGFEKIIASEMDPRAVARLAGRKLSGVSAMAADLFYPRNWPDILKAAQEAKTLVLDPPREGFKGIEEFVVQLPKLERIFYISCDASRFFHEAKLLKEKGWKLKEVQPVDQFPHTPHVELLAFFQKD